MELCDQLFDMKALKLFFLFTLFKTIPATPINTSIMTSQQINSMKMVASSNKAPRLKATPANDTENGLLGPCKPITTLFARGTGESGNVGNKNSPGPVWFADMRQSMGEENITVQGIDYNASVFGYLLGGDPEGSQKFLDQTNEAAIKCPDTKIVIGGYSQGAQLAHNAAKQFSQALTSRVTAAVLFGDPFKNQALGSIPSSSVLSICHDRDIICQGHGGATDHLNYDKDAPEATTFVIKRLDRQIKQILAL